VIRFPNIRAVGAKRRPVLDPSGRFFMQMHVEHSDTE
jgi:hypothetical protein